MNIESAVDEIKKKIDIVDYLGSFITLKKTGRNYHALCPFHSEKTPSFVVSPDRGIWRCFGACQDGGDVIAFIMKWENLTFSEAIKELAQKAGIKLETLPSEDRVWKQKERLMQINAMAAKYYHYILTQHASGKPALDYVHNRDMNDKLVETFQLGYSPQSWDSLLSFLRKKGFSDEHILEAGLAIKNDKGNVYDRFRGRLMFPIMNARHEVLGFSGRLIAPDEKQAKYVNTPETPLYHKRETLFGMQLAHETIKKEEVAILVEGEFDMISSFRHDIKNTVAIKGSAVTKDQLMLLKRYTKRIILALDADFSGTETTLRAIKDAESMDFRIDVIQFDFGKDPDEALANDPIAYKKLVKKPTPLYDFIITTALKRHDPNDPYEKKAIVTEVIPFINSIANPIVHGHYLKRLADIIDIHERDIQSMIRTLDKADYKKRVSAPRNQLQSEDRYVSIQKYILSYLFQHEKPLVAYKIISDKVSSNEFSIPSYQEIIDHFEKFYKAANASTLEKFNIQSFTENFADPLQAVLDELFLTDISAGSSAEDADKSLEKTILELKQLSLRDKIKKAVHSADNDKLISSMTKELAQVEKELRIL